MFIVATTCMFSAKFTNAAGGIDPVPVDVKCGARGVAILPPGCKAAAGISKIRIEGWHGLQRG